MEGRCQCGQIKFKTPTDKPKVLYVCHCWDCRHQASGLFGMTALFAYFKLESPFEGALSYYDRPNPNGTTRGYFCTRCGCRIIHESISPSGEPASSLSVKAGCLDGLTKDDYRKAIHIWTKSAVSDIPEGVEAHEGEPEGGSFAQE